MPGDCVPSMVVSTFFALTECAKLAVRFHQLPPLLRIGRGIRWLIALLEGIVEESMHFAVVKVFCAHRLSRPRSRFISERLINNVLNASKPCQPLETPVRDSN